MSRKFSANWVRCGKSVILPRAVIFIKLFVRGFTKNRRRLRRDFCEKEEERSARASIAPVGLCESATDSSDVGALRQKCDFASRE